MSSSKEGTKDRSRSKDDECRRWNLVDYGGCVGGEMMGLLNDAGGGDSVDDCYSDVDGRR